MRARVRSRLMRWRVRLISVIPARPSVLVTAPISFPLIIFGASDPNPDHSG